MLNWFRRPARRRIADPMDHPEIARMTPRELADLPLVPPAAPVLRRDEARARPAAPAPALRCERA